MKHTFTFDIIDKIVGYQHLSYAQIPELPRVMEFVNSMPAMDEKTSYEISLQIEPRGAAAKEIK